MDTVKTLDELIEMVENAHKYDLDEIDHHLAFAFSDGEYNGAPYITTDTDCALDFLKKQVKCIRILNLTDDDRIAFGVKLNLFPKGLHVLPITIRTWNSSFALAIVGATLKALKELQNGEQSN